MVRTVELFKNTSGCLGEQYLQRVQLQISAVGTQAMETGEVFHF